MSEKEQEVTDDTEKHLRRYEELNKVGMLSQKIAEIMEKVAKEVKDWMEKKP